MPPNEQVMAEIQREVKAMGDNHKEINASLQNDLTEIRSQVDEMKDSDKSGEYKAKIDAFTESILAKQDALEELNSKTTDQLDALETAFNRSPSVKRGDEPDFAEDATHFFDSKAAATGSLAWKNRAQTDTVDVDGYELWAKSFGHYLRASDDRDIEAKALSVGSNPNGGYLVPTATSRRIIQKIYETSPMRQLATVESIGTDSLELHIDTNEADAGWVGEEQTRSETDTPEVGIQRIPVHELYAKPKATQKFLEDASINAEEWLARKTGEKMSRKEATAFITGDGILKPRGILSYPSGSAGARGTIRQVASGHATQITAEGVRKMPFQVKDFYLAGASWLMKRSTIQEVMLLKDGQGQWMWRPGLTEGQPSTLAGYTVRQADDMPAVGAGTLSMAFGNFSAGYTIVDRLGITTLRDPYSAKPFVEFYSRKRLGGDVVDFEAYALMVTSA